MTLTQTAYLEIDLQDSDPTATFEFNIGYEPQSELDKSYLMGDRGQYIRQIVNQLPLTGTFEEGDRTGFWLEGGGGDWSPSFSFATGQEDVQWGDGSGGTGQANVTKTDASGSGVDAITRMHVLQYVLAKSRSDSRGKTRLHWGEWTDGNVSHISGLSAGVYDQPMPFAITSTSFQLPDPDQGEPGTLTGQIDGSHAALFGGFDAPDWADPVIGAVQNAAEEIPDE